MNRIPDEAYKVCLQYLPIVTVDLVIFNPAKDKVLLFKRTNEPLAGYYYSPGGRIFKNQTIQETALRVASEELGWRIPFSQLFFGGVMDEQFETSIYPDIDAHCVNIFFGFIADPLPPVRLDPQHFTSKWLPIDDPSLHPYLKHKINTLLGL